MHAILATIGHIHPNFTFIQFHSKRHFGQSPIRIDSNILLLKVLLEENAKSLKGKKKNYFYSYF